MSTSGLARLRRISDRPLYASKVEEIHLNSFPKCDDWDETKKRIDDIEYRGTALLQSSRAPESVAAVSNTYRELSDMLYVERSGIDAPEVPSALQKMPNIRMATTDCQD